MSEFIKTRLVTFCVLISTVDLFHDINIVNSPFIHTNRFCSSGGTWRVSEAWDLANQDCLGIECKWHKSFDEKLETIKTLIREHLGQGGFQDDLKDKRVHGGDSAWFLQSATSNPVSSNRTTHFRAKYFTKLS